MTSPAGLGISDRFDVRASIDAEGSLLALSEATILDAADIHTALTLGRLGGGADDAVLMAAALAVRAVRFGHVYVDLATVATTVAPDDETVEVDLAALPWPESTTWATLVAASPLTAIGADGAADRPLRLIGTRLYLDRYWRHEQTVIADLLRRSDGPPPPIDGDVLSGGLRRLLAHGADTGPDDLQRLAAATAILRGFSVVAGGPGTGKTTTVARILALLHEQTAALGLPPPRVALAAPTGKAAARLAEAVHAEAATLDVDPAVRMALLATTASTLHRLLGWQPGNRSRFRHDASNQLVHTAVIVDEASMVSLSMMARLLAAVRPTARVVLVGDPRQLASVEAGAVLGDIVGPAKSLQLRPPARGHLEEVVGFPVEASDPGPEAAVADGVVVLRRVHRFGGGIADMADAVDSGDPDAVISVLRSDAGDIAWIEPGVTGEVWRTAAIGGVRQAVVEAATAVVGAAVAGDGSAALEHLRAVQVLCAHRRGPGGAAAWRTEIERWLRSAIPGYGGGLWYVGRPLLVTENDYGLGVFNGDTGVVIDSGGGRLRAVFDRRGEVLEVRPTRLASVESLYAMTIHKAQGSEFRHVVVVLPDTNSQVLTRELLYTGITRAQNHLTVVASEAAIRAAVMRPIARASGLADALWPPVGHSS
ncbi:MAG: exodeoxyribonuclease V subunit alpha [Actinomycetota bacterium]|nr:exodeoxyribonuclease V subunit alpha [Actinomycetota bacterium]